MSLSTSGLEGQRRPGFNVDSIFIVQMEEGAQAEGVISPATEITPKPVDQEEPSSFSDLSRLSQKDRLVELTKMAYRDFQIGIFTDSLETPPRRFFFEPVVFLDPRKIFSESHGLYKEDVVRFTVQMWTPDIRLKVLERLRSLPALAKQVIQLDDVQVIPFDDVQLAHNPECIQKPMYLMNPPIPYRRMNESLEFYLLCDSPTLANQLADQFRRNPEFSLKKWQLRLVCRGLALGNHPAASVKFSFNVTPAPQDFLDVVVPLVPHQTYFGGQMNSNLNSWANVVPVFSAKRCPRKVDMSFGNYVTYTGNNFETKNVHGNFMLATGHFTVKTPGIYQFHFNGQVLIGDACLFTRAELVVNDDMKAVSRSPSKSNLVRVQPISLSALLPLKAGDRAAVRLVGGTIYVDDTYVTRFEGILFADK